MAEAYEIGISLALEDGVSAGIAAMRRDLSLLDHAIAVTSQHLAELGSGSITRVAVSGPPNTSSDSLHKAASNEPSEQKLNAAASAVVDRTSDMAAAARSSPAKTQLIDRRSVGGNPRAPEPIWPPTGTSNPIINTRPVETVSQSPVISAAAASFTEAELSSPTRIVSPSSIPRAAKTMLSTPPPAAPASNAPLGVNFVAPVASLQTAPREAVHAAKAVVRGEPTTQRAARQPTIAPLTKTNASAPLSTSQSLSPIKSLAQNRANATPISMSPPTSAALAHVVSSPYRPVQAATTPSFIPAELTSRAPPPQGGAPATDRTSLFTTPQQASFAPSASSAEAITLQGDIILDGARVGRWLTRNLARQAARPSASPTGPDPRQTPLWSGQAQGF